ncbi:MAG: TetR/AcrR family transcriptional regulator [Microbacteriaceae bacterium]
MSTASPAPDRRASLKARHREAILDAADALISERDEARFSVDELAERADISRRTVFNHFASLDDVVMTACTRVLTAAVDEFWAATEATPVGDGSRAALFDEFTTAMRAIDLPTVVSYLTRVLGPDEADPRSHHLVQDVFTRTADQVATAAAGRSSEVDQLDAEILTSSMMNGLGVIAHRWIRETGGTLDAASRAVWNDLLDRLIATVRRGYAPAP